MLLIPDNCRLHLCQVVICDKLYQITMQKLYTVVVVVVLVVVVVVVVVVVIVVIVLIIII